MASMAGAVGGRPVRTSRPKQAARKGWAQHFVEPGWYAGEVVPAFLQHLHVHFPHSALEDLLVGIRGRLVVDVLSDSSQEELEGEEEIMGVNVPAAAEIALRMENQELQAQVKRLKRSNARFQDIASSRKTDSTNLTRPSEFFYGRCKRYLSVRGGCWLVLRRLISGMSANRLGLALSIDIHRTSVCRWEMLFAASLLARVRHWYSEMQRALAGPVISSTGEAEPMAGERHVRFATHWFCGDATNALVWQKTKIHTCRVESAYWCQELLKGKMPGSSAEVSKFMQLFSEVEVRRSLCDLLEVGDGKGESTHALYKKHFQSVGCPHWTAAFQAEDESGFPKELLVCITYIAATDSGGDEELAKTMGQEESVDADTNPCLETDAFSVVLFFFGTCCWMHQYYLGLAVNIVPRSENTYPCVVRQSGPSGIWRFLSASRRST